MFRSQLQRLRAGFGQFPRSFWTVAACTFIDRLGGALLFPFFTLYVTKRFGVGMTEVGVLFGLFSISGFLGSILGGGLTDRIGRKSMLIFSLISTAVSSLILGAVNSIQAFAVVALVSGIFTDIGGPAQQAVVADILPEEQRAQGFGIIRVVFNLSVTIGPLIGGFLASRSYMLLFIADAVTSLITAVIIYFALPETKPQKAEGAPEESLLQTYRNYGVVLRDAFFMLYMAAWILVGLVYFNMNTTLGVYLRDVQGVPEKGYGILLSINAAMVVLLQFPITRKIKDRPPFVMMALGTLLYAIGFALYGPTTQFAWFVVAMVIITIGEMIIAPVAQAMVANLAPEDMRGRYMGAFSFSWVVTGVAGPLGAGLIMDNFDPRWLWYIVGLLGLIPAAIFVFMHRRSATRLRSGSHLRGRAGMADEI